MISFSNSMERVVNTMSYMTHHLLKGHAIHLTKWRATRILDFGINIEETLVSPAYVEALIISPVGTHQCGCCKKTDIPFEYMKPIAVHIYDQYLMCDECYEYGNLSDVKRIPMKFEEDLEMYLQAITNIGCMEVVDTRFDDFNEKVEANCVIAEQFAQAHNMSYISGKNIANIREELLAKRVLRKWKKMVNTHRQLYLFKVLYDHLHDINASIILAKQHATQLPNPMMMCA